MPNPWDVGSASCSRRCGSRRSRRRAPASPGRSASSTCRSRATSSSRTSNGSRPRRAPAERRQRALLPRRARRCRRHRSPPRRRGRSGLLDRGLRPGTGEIEALEVAAERVAVAAVRAARADRARREPSPRRRRSRRHDPPAGGLPRRRRRRPLRARPRRPGLDLRLVDESACRSTCSHCRAARPSPSSAPPASAASRPEALWRGTRMARCSTGRAELRDAGTSRFSQDGTPAEALRAALGGG